MGAAAVVVAVGLRPLKKADLLLAQREYQCMYGRSVSTYRERVFSARVCVWKVSGSGLGGGRRGVCSRHVTAMYDTA